MKDVVNIDEAHENYVVIVALRKNVEHYFWALLKQLKDCRERRWWMVLGYESWKSYLALPEIDLAVQTVDNYLTVYNKLEQYHLLPLEVVNDKEKDFHSTYIGVSKLAIVTPYMNEENAKELYEKARTLSRSDLIAEVTGKEREIKEKCTCPVCGDTHDKKTLSQP
jgi:hypothetical protein